MFSKRALLSLFAFAFAALAAEQGTVVDSGTFSIKVGGRRIATETFRMEQQKGVNIATAQFQMLDDAKASQTAHLELLPNGNLRKYIWKEINPTKAQVVVEPQDEAFWLLRKTETEGGASKDNPQPVLQGAIVLDDNFFSQRQVLAWRYLATGCRPAPEGGLACTEQKLLAFNPHQELVAPVTVSVLGTQRLKLPHGEKNCKIIKLVGEGGDWTMWVDEQNKLQKIVIAAENIEVLRD
jgi:hypothetical protein